MSGLMTSVEVLPRRSVWPSGSDSATARAAIVPPAPPRLSTTTGWPSASDIFGEMGRAITSAGPPGTKPTMMRIGFVGKVCAVAAPGARHRTPAIVSAIHLIVMVSAPCDSRTCRPYGGVLCGAFRIGRGVYVALRANPSADVIARACAAVHD